MDDCPNCGCRIENTDGTAYTCSDPDCDYAVPDPTFTEHSDRDF